MATSPFFWFYRFCSPNTPTTQESNLFYFRTAKHQLHSKTEGLTESNHITTWRTLLPNKRRSEGLETNWKNSWSCPMLDVHVLASTTGGHFLFSMPSCLHSFWQHCVCSLTTVTNHPSLSLSDYKLHLLSIKNSQNLLLYIPISISTQTLSIVSITRNVSL